MSNPKEDVLRQSGPLPISKEVIDASSAAQIQIYSMLNRQDINQGKTNDILFSKMDEAAGLARTAVAAAEETKATMEAQHAGLKTLVETKFRELNGTIANVKLDVKALQKKDDERTVAALQQVVTSKAVKAVTAGVWIIPKLTWRQIGVICAVMTFIGLDRIIAVVKTLAHIASKFIH
jgi:hypothetical protein